MLCSNVNNCNTDYNEDTFNNNNKNSNIYDNHNHKNNYRDTKYYK